ncbi:hypothetical protein ACOME3_002370 [Neoechinorhynchus agilis]
MQVTFFEQSSTKLRVWTPGDIDEKLNEAATEFCTQHVQITTMAKIRIHRLFDWYGLLDFGKSNRTIIK